MTNPAIKTTLFSPIRLGALDLPNRLVMAPMTRNRAAADETLAAGADLISLGRAYLANPDLVERLRRGAPLNAVRGQYLMNVGGAAGYTDYPALAASGD